MAFDGTEGENITLAQASEWTANYRNNNPDEVIAHFYGKSQILAILAQSDAVGIRIYYGIDEEEKKQLILVGADRNENDLFDGIIKDFSRPCPPRCGEANELNGL